MKLSLNWLKEFVKIPENISPEKLGLDLTLKTVEVEGVELMGKYLADVVVGKIVKIEKHPNADKLKICLVDIGGKEEILIVCGGINLREEMLTAIAKTGAKVKWHGGEEFIIQKTKVRGVESNGMICTSSELALEDFIPQGDEREIIDLGKEAEIKNWKLKVGYPLKDVLGLDDVIFEIDNKSITNRPDLWGHFGMAREVAAIYGLNFPSMEISKDYFKGKKNIDIEVKVKDTDLCPRYMAVAMSGIKIEFSPEWLEKRLIAAGMRPINNIVDITNYVMLELGQPMHAFDKFKVQNSKSKVNIEVRKAKEGEKIVTLDNAERKLDENTLVIAADGNPAAIAGVMGGENSEIDEKTETIIIESANFEKVNNRKTAARLGLRTEAAMRYEKGLDPNLAETALKRCIDLIKQISPKAYVSSEIINIKNFKSEDIVINISTDYIRKKMGVDILDDNIINILESLGFKVVPIKNKAGLLLKINVPSWRSTGDISIPEDIVEEISRIYGYNHIEPKMPKLQISVPLENKERTLERKIKEILSVRFDMSEVFNYSFVNEKQLELLKINVEESIKLINPISSEHTLLRPSLIPNLLENVKNNLRYFSKLQIFESGLIFKDKEGDITVRSGSSEVLPYQERFVAGAVVRGKDDIPFFAAKEIVEGLLNTLKINYSIDILENVEGWMHPYRSARLENKNLGKMGFITELNPRIAEKIGIKSSHIGIFSLSLKELLKFFYKEEIRYKKLSKFPSVLRDIAIIVDKEVLARDIIKAIKESEVKLLKSVEFFDYYEGSPLFTNKKSLAFHLYFQSEERTLEDREVDDIFKKIVEKLNKKFKAELRK